MKRILAILPAILTIFLLGCGSDKSPTAFVQTDEPGSLDVRTNLGEVFSSFIAYREGGELIVIVSFEFADIRESWLGEPVRLVFVDTIGDTVNIVSKEFGGKSYITPKGSEGESNMIVTFRVPWNRSSAQANLLAATGSDPRDYGSLMFYFIRENPSACYGPVGQKFIWPTKSHHVNSGFHDPDHPFFPRKHDGIDIRATQGEPVRAIGSGYVSVVFGGGSISDFASVVGIKHTEELSSRYAHLSRIIVTRGQCVNRGELIGYSGGTPGTPGAGNTTTGPHLHLEIREEYGIPVDPLDYLP